MSSHSNRPSHPNRPSRPFALPRSARTTAAVVAAAATVVVLPGAALAEDPGIDCAEWDGSSFAATASRLDDHTVRLTMTYDDAAEPLEVCPYTVFFSIGDGGGAPTASGSTAADSIATATDVDGSFEVDLPSDSCNWEIRVAVEEALPIVIDSDELCLDRLRVDLEPLVPIRPDLFRTWAERFSAFVR